MATESQHPAERRLRALARTRREAARDLPPWSAVHRQRLRDEVARLHQRGNALPDPAAQMARSWAGWRWLWAWGGVGIASAVLVWVVLFSQPPQPETVALKTSAPAEASESEGILAPAPANAPRAAVPEILDSGDTPTSVAGGGAVPISASHQSLTAAAPARDERFDFNAARRIRHAFRTAAAKEVPPILKAFEIVQTGGGLEIIDQDGSVFSGRLPRRAPSEGRQPAWTFEAQGFSRTLGKEVRLTGNFGETASDPGGAEPSDAGTGVAGAETGPGTGTGAMRDYWQESIAASVMVAGGSVFEIHAEPVAEMSPQTPAAPAVRMD